MAACSVRTALRGLALAPGRRLQGPRPLHVSAAGPLCSSRPEPPRRSGPGPEEEEAEPPEYIPQRRAKNPMWTIGVAWMVALPTSIITFILAKREVDKNRLKQLKIRQRIKTSSEEDFEGIRYLRQRKDINRDQ